MMHMLPMNYKNTFYKKMSVAFTDLKAICFPGRMTFSYFYAHFVTFLSIDHQSINQIYMNKMAFMQKPQNSV